MRARVFVSACVFSSPFTPNFTARAPKLYLYVSKLIMHFVCVIINHCFKQCRNMKDNGRNMQLILANLTQQTLCMN